MDSTNNTLKRWRMVLGGDEADGTGCSLSGEDLKKDIALSALYEYEQRGAFEYRVDAKGNVVSRKGGRGSSSPSIARWLGDIQEYFPNSVVEILQKDAMSYPEIHDKMMLEPEILERAEPSVNLVANLMELGKLIPSKTKDTAKRVIQKVVDELMDKLENDMRESLRGALSKSVTNNRPRFSEINWGKTILKNLQHYQAEYKTIIPERLYGYGRKNRKVLKDVILCIDQSGSMGSSVVYSAIFGSVMASLPSVSTKMVLFDTEVQDLSEDLVEPVDLLFGVQLGGGTDINKALGYCQNLVTKPNDTIMVLITDLYEGGSRAGMLRKMKALKSSGVELITLLALDDDGTPYYDKYIAKDVASMDIPVFACTPDNFADLMATAIQKGDIHQWAGENGNGLVRV